jgi:hypothetical protein
MRDLIDLLGLDVTSERVRETLSRFGSFAPEVLDLAPDEGMPKDFYLKSKPAGVCLKHEADGEITTIFLMSDGREGYSKFGGMVSAGLTFSSTAEEVRSVFGPPSFERAASTRKPLAHGRILRFDRPEHSIHFQFLPGDGGIELVTLMSPKAVPGRRT